MTIQESVAAAIKEMTPEATTEEVVEVKAKEVKAEEEEVKVALPAENVLEVSESQEQIQQALNIFRTLNDPSRAGDFIAQLATTAGIAIKESATPVSTKVAAQTVTEILRESLGEENEDLVLKLAPALEKLISQEVKKPVAQLSMEQAAQQVKVQIDQVFDKFSATLPDFNKLQNEMNDIMQNIKPGPNTSMEKYLLSIYKLAGGTMPVEKSSKENSKVSPAKLVTKLVANAKETKQNVSSGVDESRVVKQSHRPSIREAVLSAAQTLSGTEK
jgi:hypothetical protein